MTPTPEQVIANITAEMIRDTAGWSQSEDDLRDTLRLAANALEAAETERDALRKALAPFIVHYEPWMDRWPDDAETSTYPRHTFGDIRRARTLLAGDNHE